MFSLGRVCTLIVDRVHVIEVFRSLEMFFMFSVHQFQCMQCRDISLVLFYLLRTVVVSGVLRNVHTNTCEFCVFIMTHT